MRVLPATLLVLLLVSSAWSKAGSTLEELREKIERGEAREEQILEALAAFDDRVAELEQQAQSLTRQGAAEADEVLLTESRMAAMEEHLAGVREDLSLTIRAFYKHGRQSVLEVLLESEDGAEMAARTRGMLRIVGDQRRRAGSLRVSILRLHGVQEKHEALLAQTTETRRRVELQRSEIEIARAAQLAVFQRLRRDTDRARYVLRRAEQAQARLGILLEQSEKGSVSLALSPSSFSSQRGRLPWPVHGRVVRGFGRYELEGEREPGMSRGLDLAAKDGAPIHVVADGIVERVGWVSGLGRTLIVRHGGGYRSIYTNARTFVVDEGDMVQQNEVVGYVGDSSELTVSRLHFELRKNARPIDPMNWLGARRGSVEFR